MRGCYATPVISWLGTSGLADRLLEGPLPFADACGQRDRIRLSAVLEYLASIGLVQPLDASTVELTDLGRTVCKRHGSFSILSSYADYFADLDGFLRGDSNPTVDRSQNVAGSGNFHSQKFFPAALRFLESTSPTIVADVGCGDGRFLRESVAKVSPEKVVGVDLSPDALAACQQQLEPLGVQHQLLEANATDVAGWSGALAGEESLVISFWFVLHEVSTGSPQVVIDMLHEVRQRLPLAQLVIGEAVRFAPEDLATHREQSILPEYQLFHAFSGQHLLAWSDWQQVLEAIPYRIRTESLFDTHAIDSAAIPSAFVWCLEPTDR